jgi:hypothetical protein
VVQLLGFFRELRHGYPDGPAFGEVRRDSPGIHETDVVGYLDNGEVLASSGEWVRDEFDEEHAPIGQLNILTDGTWVWPSDLSYYVARYHVALPGEFLADAAAHGWTPPRLSEDALARVEEEFLSR